MNYFEVCTRALQERDLSTCKPLGFDLLGWISILTAMAGLALFAFRASRKPTATGAVPKFVWRPWRARFQAMCAKIRPLMDENSRIFQEFGPNSGLGNGSPKSVRYDLSVWKALMPKIVANNSLIREIIIANKVIIPVEYKPIFGEWLNHIDAFEAHYIDDMADYRNNQFPVRVIALVHENG